jgi:ribosome-binding factor A
VGDLIREEISRLLLTEVKDPRIGMVTITDVEVSSDIKRARVFYSVGGDEYHKGQTQQGLVSASGFIRTALATHLTIKRVPEITFVYDGTLEYGEKIDTILDTLKEKS